MILKNPKTPLVVGIVAIIGLGAAVTFYRSSPGELSRAHRTVAKTSFLFDCNKCHGDKDISVGCLHCHTEIQGQLRNGKGYHAILMRQEKRACQACHSEHNGPDFPLINEKSWGEKGEKGYTHDPVSFRLSGAHARLSCADCHQSKRVPPFRLPTFQSQRRAHTYLGLNQACESCHADPHAGGRSGDCQRCHAQTSFRPTVGFNHDRYFPLKGGHAKLECRKCHTIETTRPAGQELIAFPFAPVKANLCQQCHTNPHRTRFQVSCESCHQPTDLAWSNANSHMTPKLHALSGYRLDAPHDQARCDQCHAAGLPYARRFPDPAGSGYTRKEKDCEGCHQDPHGGQFREKYPRCSRCHTLPRFSPSTFEEGDHDVFPLTGGHAGLTCVKCHPRVSAGSLRRFTGISPACNTCHRDPHIGQFKKDGDTRCERCHQSPAAWKKLVFDHNVQSQFKLDQTHVKLECRACHPQVSLANGTKIIQYKPIRRQCRDCHQSEMPQ